MLFFQKQIMMRRVLAALLPVFAFALYLYGLRLVILTVIVLPAALSAEFIFERLRTPKNKKALASEAALVTGLLFLLSLPPGVPWWIALIGILFAVIIGKEVFGGFGKNVFNPAISGRLFIYIAFPNYMTASFLSAGNFGVDALSSATPLSLMRGGKELDYLQMAIGIRPGSFGESALILITIAAIFLIATKTASFRIMLSTILGAGLLSSALFLAGVPDAFHPVGSLLSGSLIFVAVFFATDPVSAPKNHFAQWFYGLVIGCTSILIRQFSLFSEGTSFAVLAGNTFAPLFDVIFKKRKA